MSIDGRLTYRAGPLHDGGPRANVAIPPSASRRDLRCQRRAPAQFNCSPSIPT